jgi:hypothetical protein
MAALWPIFIASAVYMLLHLIAPLLNPPHFFWGVRFFPFLFEGLLAIPAVALGYMIWNVSRNTHAEAHRDLSPRTTFLFLAILCLAAVLAANIDAFVLGDGENVLFQIINPGEQKLVREPLVLSAAKLFKEVAKAVFPAPDMRNVQIIAEHSPGRLSSIVYAEHALTLLGIACLVIALFASRQILWTWFPDGRSRLLAGVFLLGSGYLVLFAGYAEYYSAAIALNILFHAFLSRSLKDKAFTWAAALTYGISCTAYVGMVAYFPVFLLAVWQAREKSYTQLALHAGFVSALVTGVFFAIGYSPAMIWTYFAGSVESSSSHIIPFGGPASIKHAYTAFSPYHFLDLANILLLVNPIAVVITIQGIVALIRKRSTPEREEFVLLTSVGCSLAMMFLVNCDIGMIADWDLVTPFTIPIVLYALWIIARRIPAGTRRMALSIGAFAITAHTALWMWTLSNADASISRLHAMQNRETFSVDGLHYTSTNIARYCGRTGLTAQFIAEMERLTDSVLPDDPRGYFTLAQMNFERNRPDLSLAVLRRAIDRGIADYRIESQYAKMLREQGDVSGAIDHYRAYLTKLPRGFADSSEVSVRIFYLGVCYTQADSAERAIEAMHLALRWDPRNARAQLMLSQLYFGVGRTSEALTLVKSVSATATEPTLRSYADSLLRSIESPRSLIAP